MYVLQPLCLKEVWWGKFSTNKGRGSDIHFIRHSPAHLQNLFSFLLLMLENMGGFRLTGGLNQFLGKK